MPSACGLTWMSANWSRQLIRYIVSTPCVNLAGPGDTWIVRYIVSTLCVNLAGQGDTRRNQWYFQGGLVMVFPGKEGRRETAVGGLTSMGGHDPARP